MDTSLKIVQQLVKDFKANEKAFLSPSYQESQVRQDFIDKFFTALGWDVTHTIQKNPYEQEVKIENKVTTQGSQRRADYAFFNTPNYRDVKFFAEAKKPARNLKNADYFHQTIRYGWNAGTPIAVLTDFEEFHILDCRYKPNIGDALNRSIKYFHYSQYADEETFKEIFFLFGREAVANASIEKFAANLSKPRKKDLPGFRNLANLKSVDEDFLESLDEYRNILAKAFKKENQDLDGEELTEAVQRTLDRLVFIRFLEDKGIEEPEIIGLYQKSSVWKAFIALCKQYEPKYNGLIFKPHRILDSGNFNPPDDKAFADISIELSDPTSPYDFDKIPISILGSIYERFLGKVVHATAKQARVEEKPEVRKAGGVYYTPEYIVRYIVKETVGKLIEGKTPNDIAVMSFADIACGSGSFLIEVYNLLLEYHERWYNAKRDKRNKDETVERDGHLYISLKKKKEILLNNIYGVDIDFQATEVTQLSLYLKLLENVTPSEMRQTEMFKEQILPNLSNNIICGNSLIGTDIYDGDLFEREKLAKSQRLGKFENDDNLKPMNFEDVFPQIMKRGGFDAVVGNPPYIRIQALNETSPQSIEYFKNKYIAASSGNYDIYVVFVEKVLRLIKFNGIMGYILPHKFFNAQYGEKLRELISKGKNLSKIVHFEDQQIFPGATTYTCLLFLRNEPNETFSFIHVTKLNEWVDNNFEESYISTESATEKEWNFSVGAKAKVLDHIRQIPIKLGDLTSKIAQGIRTSANEVYVLDAVKETELLLVGHSKKLNKDIPVERIFLSKFLLGKEIKPYTILPSGKFVIIPYRLVNENANLIEQVVLRRDAPKTFEYLSVNKDFLSKREKGRMKGEKWYAFIYPKNMDVMKKPKILVPDIANKASFALDEKGEYAFTSGYAIILKDNIPENTKYILGLLNSKVLDLYLKSISTTMRGGYFRYFTQFLEQLPIRTINFDDLIDKSRHDNIVNLVGQMLEAKQKRATSKTDAEVNRLELLCQSLDRKIDEAVYELYGLTEDEVRIVEGEK